MNSEHYIDLCIAAMPTADREAYRQHAAEVAAVVKQHGVLQVVECWGDDVPAGQHTSLPLAVQCRPDETPEDGMAEWQIAADAWLQLDGNADGQSAVVIGVEDVAACRQALLHAGIAAAEIVDYGFVQVCDTQDPHGNRVSFVQVMTKS